MTIVSNSSIQSLTVPKIYAYTTYEFENTKWVGGKGNG
jgi:hypothetical protein